ncbi:MAG: hypothetical protein HKM04_05825 [Legionellales bacterium]|nr:hypothetical protein [Legionellales bacterium]
MLIIKRKIGQKIIIKEEGREPITITALSSTANIAIDIGIEASATVEIICEEKIERVRLPHQYKLSRSQYVHA